MGWFECTKYTPIHSRPFLRKPVNLQQSGRSSDLLIISNLPIPKAGTVAYNTNELTEFTATGIVPDFHRIPFSSLSFYRQEPDAKK